MYTWKPISVLLINKIYKTAEQTTMVLFIVIYNNSGNFECLKNKYDYRFRNLFAPIFHHKNCGEIKKNNETEK